MPETRSQLRKNDPVATSTPRAAASSLRVSGRDAIRNSLTMQSPIIADAESEISGEDAAERNSDAEDSTDPEEQELPQEEVSRKVSHTKECATIPSLELPTIPVKSVFDIVFCLLPRNFLKMLIYMVVFAVVSNYVWAGVCYIFPSPEQSLTTRITLSEIQASFPAQSKEFWSTFNSGISEVEKFAKPSVFLLLYEAKTQSTIDELVRKMSLYSVCIIKANCTLNPIVLSKSVLTSDEALRDYGRLIDEYKPELENKGVMVVNNIEQITGSVAQIFQSMCDEIEPLVHKTVFIFTLKIDKFPSVQKADMKLVESVLHNKWSDLKDDLFYPLFTRISNIVLRVVPEK